jgi:uncharacterized SAM-binding protein YcdF (DUF218 family)
VDAPLSLTYLAAGIVVPPVSLLLLAFAGLWLARRRRCAGSALAAGSLLALLLLSLPVVAFALMTALEGPPPPDPRAGHGAGAVVILGGGVARGALEWGGDTVGGHTLLRVRYGAHLARATGLPVLVTGAAPRLGRAGEAELMRALLEGEFGVGVRWFDGQARHTADNARHAAALLRADGVQRVLLVTSAFHLPRARRSFERQGLQVQPAPTGFMGYAGGGFEPLHLLPDGEALRVSHIALRELAARLWYRLGGRG